ncbi:MAG: AAA family ATPase, partial [Methanoregula sp.]
MDNEYLIRLIYEYNPQLAGHPVAVPEFRRDLYAEIQPWLPKKQAIAIVGLRRTGKTTLMRQLMEETGGEKKALFFSF